MKKVTWSRIKNDFNFNSVSEVYFWKSEWEAYDPHDHEARVSPVYFAYRFLYMGWFIGSVINTFACDGKQEDADFYLIFLTNQTFILQLIYSVLFFLYVLWVVVRRCSKQPKAPKETANFTDNGNRTFHDEKDTLPIICKVIWILLNILQVIPYVVTVVYWIFLFGDSTHDTTCSTVNNIIVHGLNSPMALLDFIIIAVPIRRTHFVFAIIAGVWYGTFSGLYELFGGQYYGEDHYIYPMLDWRDNPGLAIGTVFGTMFGAILIHFGIWNLYRLRVFIKSKYGKSAATI